MNILTTHSVDKKELHNMMITTRALDKLTPQEIRDLRYVFDIFNKGNTGFLHAVELRKALRVLGFKCPLDEVRKRIADSTVNLPSDLCDFNGFLDIVIDLQGVDPPDYYDDLVRGFERMDLEHRGRVSLENLKQVCEQLGMNFSEQEMADMINEADIDGDGQVNLDEFVQTMKQTHLFL